MISLKLDQLLFVKGVDKPYSWLKKQGINRRMAERLLKGEAQSVPFKVMNTLCMRLYCTPDDLFQWAPETQVEDIPAHPLQKLKSRSMPNVGERLKQLTPDELFELDKKIDEIKGGG